MTETTPEKGAVQPERRRALRFPFSAEAEVTLEGSEQKLAARVTEIGPQGCYLQMGKPLDTGSAIFVKFFAESKFFETKANVVYSQPNRGMGVSFREMKPYFVDVLRKWLLEAMISKNKPRDGLCGQ
ncbi:MAG TPA: PilZ domain-containing protein [Candidatus Sulfotelmatobacter sp.]|nr:PilZ domain-containing protein [Candidatus Sulfotelmatobacter sp.]